VVYGTLSEAIVKWYH